MITLHIGCSQSLQLICVCTTRVHMETHRGKPLVLSTGRCAHCKVTIHQMRLKGEEGDESLTVSRRSKFSSQQQGDCCFFRLRHSIYPTRWWGSTSEYHTQENWSYYSFRCSEVSIRTQWKRSLLICWNLSLSCRVQGSEKQQSITTSALWTLGSDLEP